MIKHRLYLDNCCFNRPYDDQAYLTVYLETEAKLFVQKEILQGSFELAWSYMLDYENSMNPYEERRKAIENWKKVSVCDIDFSIDVNLLGNKILSQGLKSNDALHIACAIAAKCAYFLTTDKNVLNKQISEIIVMNPIDFVRKLGA